MKFDKKLLVKLCMAAMATVTLPFGGVQAADPQAVIIETQGIQITAADLDAELKRAPADVRNSLLFRKEGLAQLASNLLLRRVLAKSAEAAGVGKDIATQANLQLARDRVMSEVQLIRMDQANTPNESVLNQRALDVYRAEIKRFKIPEEIQMSHILVALTEENAEAKAAAILEELKNGKDFAELAKAKSQDPGSGSKGGELGYVARGKMVKEFEEAAFALKTGQLSGLVKTQFGFHVIKVTDRKDGGVRPFEEVRQDILIDVKKKIQTEGRIKAAEQILRQSNTYPENLDKFVANQAEK